MEIYDKEGVKLENRRIDKKDVIIGMLLLISILLILAIINLSVNYNVLVRYFNDNCVQNAVLYNLGG